MRAVKRAARCLVEFRVEPAPVVMARLMSAFLDLLRLFLTLSEPTDCYNRDVMSRGDGQYGMKGRSRLSRSVWHPMVLLSAYY